MSEQLKLFPNKVLEELLVEKPSKTNELKESFKNTYEPSIEEFEKYDNAINKEVFWEINMSKPTIYRNTNTHSMLINSLQEFTGKPEEQLVESDALIMYRTINNKVSKKRLKVDSEHNTIGKFREVHNLTRFGGSQYDLLEKFVKKHIEK